MKRFDKYNCTHCLSNLQTKKEFDRHTSICKFIHTSKREHDIDQRFLEKLPSPIVMFQYIVDLSENIEKIKEEIIKLKKNNYQQRKKTVSEYLEYHVNIPKTYTEWFQEIVVTDAHLNIMFENDLRECLKQMIIDTIENMSEKLPICSFSQKSSTIYIFEQIPDTTSKKWRVMTSDEIKKFVLILSQRVLRKYSQWQNENREKIANDETFREKQMIYMQKVNGGHTSIETRISEIKRILVSNVQISLKNVDAS